MHSIEITEFLGSINITDSAIDYLAGLLEKQNCEGITVRMFIIHPGTPEAETCLSYCRPGEQLDNDILSARGKIDIYFENNSLRYLKDARVDYNTDKMGGELTIKAPNSRMPNITDDSPLEDRINYVLWNDINPSLASHGGSVSLVELKDNVAILRFGGGCQGCSQLNITLKDGVEKTLLSQLPQLTGVRDITDHSDSSKAYFQ